MSFKSVMTTIWDDVKKVIESPAFSTGLKVAESVVDIAVPALGPAFTLTANAVLSTEANFAAVGKSAGTGPEKLTAVLTSAGNLISVALQDAGVKNVDQAKVESYVSAVVTMLNAAPSTTPSETSGTSATAPPTATA